MAVVFHVEAAESSWGLEHQMWITGLYFSGIPIILCAAQGVWHRHAANVWVYVYYLLCCCAYDWITTLKLFILTDPCDTLHRFVQLLGTDYGEAFVCGGVRTFSYSYLILVVSVEIYALYVVWSFCGGVKLAIYQPSMHDIQVDKYKRYESENIRPRDFTFQDDDVVGVAHTTLRGPYPSPYGSIGAVGEAFYPMRIAGQGGTHHNMAYPPKPCDNDKHVIHGDISGGYSFNELRGSLQHAAASVIAG
jgi:hypothetical protein